MGRTIVSLFNDGVKAGGDRTAFLHKDGDRWAETSFAEAAARVEAIGTGLFELGVRPGDRVAILANSRLEWTLADYAILLGGAISVPIYQTNSPAECEYILNDASIRTIFVEDAAQLAKVREVRGSLPALKDVVIMDPAGELGAGDDGLVSLADLEERGRAASSDAWREAGASVTPDQLATFIYTSGTTGPPKGCMLSHGNYAEMTEMLTEAGEIMRADDRVVLFLPLAHTFARLIQFSSMRLNVELAYSTILTLMDDLAEVKPTILPSVPRVFEKAHTRISSLLNEATGAKAKLVQRAMRVGALRGKYLQHGRRVPPVLAARYALAHKLVFHKIHDRFGGNLRLCISGGAPLGRDVQEFFLSAGIVILEGYGLTEATTATNLNRPDNFRVGTVGPALPRTEVKIADDGEILMRGPQIFQGYHNNDEATREVKTADGWLHSGDIGTIDRDGFLYITDRKKDIIVTAGGKNISPQNIENGLKATQYISQALVFGDRKPYLTALITLDPIEMESFAQERGLPTDMHELVARDEVMQLVRAAVDKVNEGMGKVSQVKRFRILPIDFTQETGELTPTLKLKRKVVCERYRNYIEQMYDPEAPDHDAVTDRSISELQTPVTA